jgi:hypothetical protein
MSRSAVLAFVLLISSSFLAAQDSGELSPEKAGETGFGFCSVALLVNALYAGTFPWQPDWPPAFPPDGFVLAAGRAASLTLTLDSVAYTLRRDERGFLEEFPFPLDGTLRGVRAELDSSGLVREFRIDGEVPVLIEVLEYAEDPLFPVPVPSRTRIFRGEEVCFAVLAYKGRGFSETWFDAEGGGLAFWEADFILLGRESRPRRLEGTVPDGGIFEEWDYDSGGNTTALRFRGNPDAEEAYSALYNQRGLPRYWERWPSPELPESYVLQWDEGGLLVRLSGSSGPGEGDLVDLRYEYTLDERGNWTERREIRMLPHFGVLFPAPGVTVKRIIDYNTNE